ncbi:MAG: hypothetical protein UW79_C0005G0045 [Candidatus Yanofskybacteria bacterium GW2011_GWA2_44_9]|uniref:dTDP-4-dehydrorhamnose reductase n=1 Tax=Candidatus Yanofskybacteria bacterium GW2011_GWA2_44_9 TaxID=1619025 RepID=A0A0G1KG78_9BACT|nr:MAG: hypothetical protein UW79_C0005G0045 [Candidatus Yanofskybacteria bacterium GW2011_GWA2_44_9]
MGSRFVDYMKGKEFEIITEKLDITDLSNLRKSFKKIKPDVVINFAGVRAHPNIDWCEDHKIETVQVNVTGAANAMLASLEIGSYPIQISSGCIYSGGIESEFTEDDQPNFYGSFYSRMRIVMQDLLKELPVLQVRIRMPISSFFHPRNTITKLISYKKVISIPNSVTLIEDLYPALERLIDIKPTGILNLTNEGYISHEQILKAYKRIIDPGHKYQLISLNELDGPGGILKAKRSNCVLSAKKAKGLGVGMPRLTDERIEEIMRKYKINIAHKASL